MRTHSHGLRKLVDDKSVASCQQTSCELLCKLVIQRLAATCLDQVVTILQLISCSKPVK